LSIENFPQKASYGQNAQYSMFNTQHPIEEIPTKQIQSIIAIQQLQVFYAIPVTPANRK